MCQICESPFRICQWGNSGFYIIKNDLGQYQFRMEIDKPREEGKYAGYDIILSEAISYCPYCGRDLTTEFVPPTIYWRYLNSLDDPEAIRILLELGKQWQREGKDLDYELTKYMKW